MGCRALAAAVALTAAINALALTGPAYTLLIFDRVLPAGAATELLAATALMLVLYAAGAVVDFARQRVIAGAALRIDRAIGALAARRPSLARGDVARMRSFLASQAPAALCDLPWLPLYLLALVLLHPLFCAVALVGAGAIAATLLLLEPSATTRRSMLAAAILRALRPALQSATLGLGAHLVMVGACRSAAPLAAAIVLARLIGPLEILLAHWRSLAAAVSAARRIQSLAARDLPASATPARELRIVLRRSSGYARNASRGAAVSPSSDLRPTAQ